MIAPIVKGGDFKGVLEYHFQKIEEGEASVIRSSFISDEFGYVLNEFENGIELSNVGATDPVWHVSLNLPHGEKLSEEIFREISEDYLQGMGYGNSNHMTFLHEDKDHQHVHIVSSKIDLAGNRINQHKDWNRSADLLRKLEVKYDLQVLEVLPGGKNQKGESVQEINMIKFQFSNAIQKGLGDKVVFESVNNKELEKLFSGKKQLSDLELKGKMFKKVDGKLLYKNLQKELGDKGLVKFSDKQKISKYLGDAYSSSSSKEEYLEKLKGKGVYARVLDSKLKYGLPDKGRYFWEDKLSKRYSFDNVKLLEGERSSKLSRDQKGIIKEGIVRALNGSNSTEDFTTNLKKIGVDVKYATNSRGIYGVSFKVESINNSWHKGTDVHRQLSWNVIEKNLKGFVGVDQTEKFGEREKEKEKDTGKGGNSNKGVAKKLKKIKGWDHKDDAAIREARKKRDREEGEDDEKGRGGFDM
jgi:hypothetical protein